MDALTPEQQDSKPAFVAWAVHVLTASGTVLAFLALLAVEQERWRLALLWLSASLVVDGIDGPLARWAGVVRRTPGINGATLDLVVDYLTYVFVPAMLIYRAGLLPTSYAAVAVGAILVSSLYTFARTDMKTADNFFLGFPALWNIIAFYLFVLQAGALVGVSTVGLFVLLTFAPIHFAHPLGGKQLRSVVAGFELCMETRVACPVIGKRRRLTCHRSASHAARPVKFRMSRPCANRLPLKRRKTCLEG
jgi:phosphatidylcholine synthase